MNEDRDDQKQELWMEMRGWLFVCGLALFFLLYGFLMFFMIGDKGPPEWDFGAVKDIPGDSIYSTNEPITGGTTQPEPQHVAQKPLQAEMDVQRRKP